MQFAAGIEFQPTETLKSGQFYWAHGVAHCYRINEVDHFRQDQEYDLLCFVDQKEGMHHFNRPAAKLTACTYFADFLSLPNLRELRFAELRPESLRKLLKNQNFTDTPSILLNKVVMAFAERQASEAGQDYRLTDLQNKYMKDFIRSREVR